MKSCHSWQKGVDKHCDNASKSVNSFRGPTSKMGKTLAEALKAFVTKLKYLQKSGSEFIRWKASSMLQILSLMANVGCSPTVIIKEYEKVVHSVSAGYQKIVWSLSDHIGYLTGCINEAITNLEHCLHQALKEYIKRSLIGDCKTEIDLKPVLMNLHKLMNIVSLISYAALNGCDVADAVRESIYVVYLISFHWCIMSLGTLTSIIAAQCSSSSVNITHAVRTFLQPLDPLVSGCATALSADTTNLTEAITIALKSVVNLTASLNVRLEEVIGSVGDVEQVIENLTRSVSSTITGITTDIGNLLGGL